jgi:RNA polymerase subunit RPABC4/transcription elongation factor Spt4
VAVNFGWRKIGDSYLVATLVDDVGVSSQVVLPDEIPSSIEYAEHLISVRDRIFNEFRTDALSFGNAYKVFPQELLDGVKAFLESKGKHGNVQQSLAGISGGKFNWFLDRVIKAHLTDEQRALLWHQWLEKHFFDMEKWNAHPRGPKPDLWEPHFETFRSLFYGSEMSTEMVLAFWYETWRQKHMHLTSWANNQKAKAIRRRMDFYRNVAAKLSVQYERIVVDDTDFSKLARRLTSKQKESLPIEEVAIREQGNSHRFLVAPSELRDCMVYRFGKDNVIKVKAENVTKHHAKDGGDLVYLVGSDVGTCSHCGTVVNIDKNACENLLLRSGRWSNLDALHVDSDNDVANVEPDAMPMAGE